MPPATLGKATAIEDADRSQSQSFDSRNVLALSLIGGAFVGTVALTMPFAFTQFRSPLPYMATPRGKITRALEFVSSRRARARRSSPSAETHPAAANPPSASGRQRPNFVDLGSGDGTAVLTAASLGWNAAGLELNPTLWLVSYLRRLFSPRAIRTNSRLTLGNMFDGGIAREKLRRADCILIFGVRPLMPKIADLVERECRPGCFVMSYRFRVPMRAEVVGSASKTVGDVHGAIAASMIYDKEEMRIYELTGK